MVIHPRFPGLKAEVIVNGSALREYNDDNDNDEDTTRTSRYVEAVSDANFEVWVAIKEKGLAERYGVCSTVFVDGNRAHATALHRSEIKSQSEQAFKGFRSIVHGRGTEAAFRFSNLVITEGEGSSLDEGVTVSLGEIEIQFHYIRNIRDSSHLVDTISASTPSGTITTKDASLEALSHFTRGDQPKPVHYDKMLTYDLVNEEPFAKFIFKYRSNESLKHLCVIPRTPEPNPMPSEQEQVQLTAPNPPQDEGSAAISIEDIKVLLNHYTGKKGTWDGFDRAALEALLNHHKASRSTSANLKKEIKKECNANSSKVLKRSHEETRAMSQGAATDVLETGARPVKRRCLPKGGDAIIEID